MEKRPRLPEFVYHVTSPEGLERIRESGGLRPQMNKRGNYVVDYNSFVSTWTRSTRYFASPIQSMILGLFGRGHDKLVLLKIKVDYSEDDLVVYDLGSVFMKLNPARYLEFVYAYQSFPFSETAIPELVIGNRIHNVIPLGRIEVVHEVDLATFGGLSLLHTRRLDPRDILARIFDPTLPPLSGDGAGKIRFMKLHYRFITFRWFFQRHLLRPRRDTFVAAPSSI